MAKRAHELDPTSFFPVMVLAWLGYVAIFDSLRSEPRFKALLKRLHFRV